MLLAHKIELRPTEEQKNTSIRLEVLRDINLINYLNTLADQKTHFHCKLQMPVTGKYALLLNGILKLRTVFQPMQFRIYTMLSVTSFVELEMGKSPVFLSSRKEELKKVFL